MKMIMFFAGCLFFQIHAFAQNGYSVSNLTSADSLLSEFKEKRCPHLESVIKKRTKKIRLDKKIFSFLNIFYNNEIDLEWINQNLYSRFKQSPWRFDEITKQGDFTKYEGRIHSNGNIESFIEFILYEDKIIAKRIYFQIRGVLDCVEPSDYLGLPDITYLQKNILSIADFPIDFKKWYFYFFSGIKFDESISEKIKKEAQLFLKKSKDY